MTGTGTGDRLPRLLALVPYLLAHPGSRLADVAEVFGVDEEQVTVDLQLLWMCGLPGYGPGDLIDLAWAEDGTVQVTHDAGMSRPLRLTAQEALALTVALRTLADVPGLAPATGQQGNALERALVKVQAAAGAAGENTSRVAVRVETTERTLATVRTALDTHRALAMTYYAAGRDETSRRTVDPMRLLLVEGRGYLEAWCRRSLGVRLFRLDRIDDIELLDEVAQAPPDAEHVDVRGGVFRPSPEHTRVVLDLAPQARWVADFYPTEGVEQLAGDRTRVTLRAADDSWARRLVLSLGTAVTVVEPDRLAEDVRELAREALIAYDQPPDTPGIHS